jgi:hypothetical protein
MSMTFSHFDDNVVLSIDATDPWTAVDTLLCGLVATGYLAGNMLLEWHRTDGVYLTADSFYRDATRITVASTTGLPVDLIPADMRSTKEQE